MCVACLSTDWESDVLEPHSGPMEMKSRALRGPVCVIDRRLQQALCQTPPSGRAARHAAASYPTYLGCTGGAAGLANARAAEP